MKLVLIHGIAQEAFEEAALKQTWIDFLQLGLKKSGLTLPTETEIVFPYYGKMLANLAAEAKKTSDTTKPIVRSSQIFDKNAQDEFEIAFLREIIAQSSLEAAQKFELEQLLKPHRGLSAKFQTTKVVHMFAKWVDGTSTGNWLLEFVETAYVYLWNYEVQNTIHKYIEKHFDAKIPCVVVGHSLGSIISYMVLNAHSTYQVKKLITLGSPLGTKTVQNRLNTRTCMPKCVKNGWFNAFDKRDIVALYPLNEKYFNIKPLIENYSMVHNKTENAHGIEDYLKDERVAKTIYDALISN